MEYVYYHEEHSSIHLHFIQFDQITIVIDSEHIFLFENKYYELDNKELLHSTHMGNSQNLIKEK